MFVSRVAVSALFLAALISSRFVEAKCSLAVLSSFKRDDFLTSLITTKVSRPKPGNAEYPDFALRQIQAALTMFLDPTKTTLEILREQGLGRREFAMKHNEDRKELAGVLIVEKNLPNPYLRRALKIGNHYGVFSREFFEKIFEHAQRRDLVFPDNSRTFLLQDWEHRAFALMKRKGVQEIKPAHYDPTSMNVQRHYLYTSLGEKIEFSGHSFRDISFEIDLDVGSVDAVYYSIYEAKDAFKKFCAFIDDVRARALSEDFPVSTNPNDVQAYTNYIELLNAEKLYSVMIPFGAGGGASIGRTFWSGLWTMVLEKKYIVPIDMDMFAVTSSKSDYINERTAYHRGYLHLGSGE